MDERYFKRDLSWLSFNRRVLAEAQDAGLEIGERINFVAIFTSNLEEFYRVRVADHKAVEAGAVVRDDESPAEAAHLLSAIRAEVCRQLDERHLICSDLLREMRRRHVVLHASRDLLPEHRDYVRRFFREEVFPFLSPVPADTWRVRSFLRANRLYIVARVRPIDDDESLGDPQYFVIKLPFTKQPRFIELPRVGADRHFMYLEDIIRANLDFIFPGYRVETAHVVKLSRDADILIDETGGRQAIVEQVKTQVKHRKNGGICRFMYERDMPADMLRMLMDAHGVGEEELMPVGGHINLEDWVLLPELAPAELPPANKPRPMSLERSLGVKGSVMERVAKRDLLIHYPYHTFDHFIHFLQEAAADPAVTDIMLTQYRVAENSAVISRLIAAAHNGKRVTVFVELKARFDEEHNLATAEMMKAAGISILFSLPGLKVHAKVALVLRHREAPGARHYAYVSTGNFNEKTARLYADSGLFTCDPVVGRDLHRLFRTLRGKEGARFDRLLVTRFNLIDELDRLIAHEMELARSGRSGRIVLKMNALQDHAMIDRLYAASEAGVQIDLIVRGICCLVPGREFSRNIRVTRIVDAFLEHARIWCFGNGGRPKVFIGSPDWMRRNLYRRIEAVIPVRDKDLRAELLEMLRLQLADNQKAVFVDHELRNLPKLARPGEKPVRAQYAFYEYLKAKAEG